MKFSVIIPTYNVSKKVSQALDSILGQTHNDYEVIIVDGASTDNTLEVIKNYRENFGRRLRWKSEADKGIYDAMNKGIDLARGEWLYFMGSDDSLYSNDVFEKISKEVRKNDLDVIYGSVMWGNTGKVYDGRFSLFKLMRKNICHQAIFFKRSVFQRFGKYDLKYRVLADYVFNMQWFSDDSVKRKYINMIIANYSLEGQSSASSTPDEQFKKDRGKLMEKYFPKDYIAFDEERCRNKKLQQVVEEFDLLEPVKHWKYLYCYLRIKSLFFKNHS